MCLTQPGTQTHTDALTCGASYQVVGMLYDACAGTLEYWLDRVYQGVVFSQLPHASAHEGPGRAGGGVCFAVSNGWEGSSRFAVIGQCRF